MKQRKKLEIINAWRIKIKTNAEEKLEYGIKLEHSRQHFVKIQWRILEIKLNLINCVCAIQGT